MNDADSRSLRLASASIATALALIGLYALDLVRCAFFVDGPDPALLGDPGPSAYFARIIGCGVCAPLIFGLLARAFRGREHTALLLCHRAFVPVLLLATLLAVVLA